MNIIRNDSGLTKRFYIKSYGIHLILDLDYIVSIWSNDPRLSIPVLCYTLAETLVTLRNEEFYHGITIVKPICY